jgi:hypothetical protein
VIDRPDFHDSSFVVPSFGHRADRTGVLEANFSGFLLAYTQTHTDEDFYLYNFQSAYTGSLAIGYAPYTGLTVVLRAKIEKDTFSANSFSIVPPNPALNTLTNTTYAIDITYLFGT